MIFDMDGVMVLTEEAHWVAWRRVSADHGVDLTRERFLDCFGQVNEDCIRTIFGAGVAAELSQRIADEKEEAFRDAVRSSVPLAPGLRELLETLRNSGVKTAVGSSAPVENVDLILDESGIRGSFDAVIDGDQVANGKPAPDVFLRAAEALELPPEACLVIEDAPAGIRAARAAGMVGVAVATSHSAEELLSAGAVEVRNRLDEWRAEELLRAIAS
ncbi:MAG: beta-phosphoglucomutase family hydrolase [Planctomycetota bacterium]